MVELDLSICVEPLRKTLNEVHSHSMSLSSDRQSLLSEAASLIATALDQREGDLGLNFICTHNSRRSHLSQVWATVAAAHYGLLPRLRCVSGGTEATACNARIVRSLRCAGFSVVTQEPLSENPRYWLQFSNEHPPVELFSKRYDDPFNGDGAFFAMMCCDHADQHCPVIAGSVGRVALHYRDPKESDDTELESATYDERRDEIGAEMFFLTRKIAEETRRVM